MLNILIRENDRFYRKGMEDMLRELFWHEYQESIHITPSFTPLTVEAADVILLGLSAGEMYLCSPKLLSRTKGIVVGLLDVSSQRLPRLPSCFDDMVFIARGQSVASIQHTVLQAWQARRSIKMEGRCTTCQHRMLSQRQYQVAAGILAGQSVPELASRLNLGEKTVFSHKYFLMNKFNLHNTRDLQRFLQCFLSGSQ